MKNKKTEQETFGEVVESMPVGVVEACYLWILNRV